MKPVYTYTLLLLLITTACTDTATNNAQHKATSPSKTELMAANKLMVKKEKQDILDYIRRHGYNMQSTGSGLYYNVYKTMPHGKLIALGDTVSVEYTLSLLNGDTIYDKSNAKKYTLVVGKSDKESGLLEALEMMKKGEKARLIVPAHLGFGLLGDQDKITTKTSLVYDIKILMGSSKNSKFKACD